MLAPEADLAAGIVLPGVYSDAAGAPWSDKDAVGTMYADGAYVAYDAATHELSCVLPGGATALIEAPGGVTIRGDVTIAGKLAVRDDVTAGQISLRDHRHTGVQAGGAMSGKPQ